MPENRGPEFAISPIDGRYAGKVKELSSAFSEFELNRHRIMVEVEYLISLSEAGITHELESNEKGTLRSLYKGFDEKDNQLMPNHTSQVECALAKVSKNTGIVVIATKRQNHPSPRPSAPFQRFQATQK